MSGSIDLHVSGPVAHVVLRHPGKLNAMSRAMWRRLREVFDALQARDDLRCVVVRGADGQFCAGGDIAEYPAFRFSETELRAFHEHEVWGGLSAMLRCDVPLLAQIDGACMGAGVEIASCCDIRLAGESARFGAPIARLGFPMAPREAWLVAKAVGELTAREMLLEAAVLDAQEMRRRGFVNQVLPDEMLADETRKRADRMTALAPQAARMTKQMLRRLSGWDPAVDGHPSLLDAMSVTAFAYADSAEHREGIAAFIARRKPEF